MGNSRRVTVIFNPNAGVGRFGINEDIIRHRLESLSRTEGVPIEIEIKTTRSKGDCRDFSKDAVINGSDVVAVAGGDGSIMEAVNSLKFSKTSLGIIPVGSGNDTITSITGHNNISKCFRDIVLSDPQNLDTGSMNSLLFLNVVGIGLDAEVNHMVAKRREMVRRIGPAMTYSYGALKTLLHFKPYHISVSIDGSREVEYRISLCTVGNGTTCGGGFLLTPMALMNDGKLDLSISEYIGRIPSILNIRTAFRGEHVKRKENTYKRFEKIILKGLERELPFHIDGEPGFAEKMELEIQPDSILSVHHHRQNHLT